MILFAQLKDTSQRKHIYAGQYLGTAILVGVSLIAAYVVHFIPEEWMIGFLGFIPIVIGVRFAIVGEEDAEEEEIVDKLNQSKTNQLFWTVMLLTIAAGGDNVGIYIPYFASIPWSEILVALIVFAIGIIVLCETSKYLSSIPFITESIEKYERVIVPVVFVLLGLYILFENGTIDVLWSLF